MPIKDVGNKKSRRSLGALGVWLFVGFGFILTTEWTRVEAEPTTRMEPAGVWGFDKQGRTTLNDVLFTGVRNQWHPNGQKAFETTFREGKLEKVLSWHSNGQKSSEITYRDGKITDGILVTWHPNGQKASESAFRDGEIIDGISVTWHENGQKAWEMPYRDGKYNGTNITWHPNGQKASETHYRDGMHDGTNYVKWDKDGQITFKGMPTALTLGAQLKVGSQGFIVTSITPQSPAARASLQVGDCLLTLESQPVPKTVADFLVQLATYTEGSRIKLIIERTGARHTIFLPWARQDSAPDKPVKPSENKTRKSQGQK